MHGMGKIVNEVHAMLKLHEQSLPKKDATPAIMAIKEGRIRKAKKNKKPQIAAQKGKGLKGSKKLKPRALNMYVGNGHCATIEAIGSFNLSIPKVLVIVLDNCHYAPSITRGVISFSCLNDNVFVNGFENGGILVSKDNLLNFHAIPRNGIYEIDLHSSNSDGSSIYAISN
ncbi:hypothetical protein Tco_0409610 [Tanacetum coccineum]